MKKALVCGAGGFIGSHLVKFLKSEGYHVSGIDLKNPDFSNTEADQFTHGDLRDPALVESCIDGSFDEIYQLAADMGGAGYLFTGDNDADVMHNSALINLNVLKRAVEVGVKKIFYSSSACIYPEFNQMDPDNPNCEENSAYPAQPDSEYGWEKLFSERLYSSFMRNYDITTKVGRFHNIFGPEGTYDGGKEKVPAAIARKVAMAEEGSNIEIWGDGKQTRSFLYVEECIEAVYRLMQSDTFHGPVNIGSDHLISINDLAHIYIQISQKNLGLTHIEGPIGVRGRNSHNDLIAKELNWRPTQELKIGLDKTYQWIESRVRSTQDVVK